MNVVLGASDPSQSSADVLVLPVFEGGLEGKGAPRSLTAANDRLGGVLVRSALREGFRAAADQTFLLHTHGKLSADRVLLVGLGRASQQTPELLRMAAGRAAKTAQRLKARSLAVALPTEGDLATNVRAATEGLVLGAYRFDRYRSRPKEEKAPANVEKVTLLLPDGAKKDASLSKALALGAEVAEATNWARDLVNEPPGVMNPARLADEARRMGKAHGLTVTVRTRKDIEKLKMGMFLGVTQGSAAEPQLIHLVYTPKKAADAKKPPLALVGKAITFDSGGLSLKTAEGMVDMKTDMAGSASVLGAMRVVAMLQPPFPVHGFMGACENMPSGTAYRPGDVLISRLGKTVEITNTDAEGRLVLGDVLAWANEHKPSAIIDLATLTGACVVALGNYIVGAFSDNDALADEVLDASKRAGEELWRMPVSEHQRDALRSEIADMKNAGERWGGAISAAVFLREFVGDTPWMHLDIAGPSTSPKERGYYGKGATGVGVRTLVELVRNRAERA